MPTTDMEHVYCNDSFIRKTLDTRLYSELGGLEMTTIVWVGNSLEGWGKNSQGGALAGGAVIRYDFQTRNLF